MSEQSELANLLRAYAIKQNNATVSLERFVEYVHKFARHFLQERPDLCVYIDIPSDELLKKIAVLQDNGWIAISKSKKQGTLIFIPAVFVSKVSRFYKDLKEKPEIPFPLTDAMPNSFPSIFLKEIAVHEEFVGLQPGEGTSPFLYSLTFPGEVPSIIFPSHFTAETMLQFAGDKIRLFLQEPDSFDFIQKRIVVSNPGKEISVRSFLRKIQSPAVSPVESMKEGNDWFTLWSYLCSLVRKEYSKKIEKLPHEVALIQSVYIAEYLNNYYRSKSQQKAQRDIALKNLDLALHQSPYQFSMQDIMNFKDTRGQRLLGQYGDKDLQDFIKEKLQTVEGEMLPEMVSFSINQNVRYYVLKENIIPLLVAQISRYRSDIKDACVKAWKKELLNYHTPIESKDAQSFEEFLLEICTEVASPLASLLKASFMPLVGSEATVKRLFPSEIERIYPSGKLAPLQVLLHLDRNELMTDTKILLPFWYTMPFLAQIFALFSRKKRPKKKKKKAEKKLDQVASNEVKAKGIRKKVVATSASNDKSLQEAVAEMIKRFVPENMTLDQALRQQLERWNYHPNPKEREILTDSVNAFIRDYMRSVRKTLSALSFDEKRIESLAQTLAETNNLSKIRDREALREYIELYILKLVQGQKADSGR